MRVKKYLKFYTALVKFQFNKATRYRLNFWSMASIDTVNIMLGLFTFYIMFKDVDNINGWDLNQILFFWGTIRLIDSILMFTVFFGVMNIPEKIKSGNLDFALIRPLNTRVLVSFESMDVASLVNSIISISIILVSISNMHIEIDFIKICGYIFLIFLMSYLYYCIICTSRLLAFWIINVDAFASLEGALIQFGYKAPGVVYKGWVKIIFYTIIPFALIGTIPAQFFTEHLSVGYWVLIFAVIFFFHCLTHFMWKRGLKKYNSASC